MCTPGDGNCLLYHAVLEQLCGNDNHTIWETTSPTRRVCTMHFARVLLVPEYIKPACLKFSYESFLIWFT